MPHTIALTHAKSFQSCSGVAFLTEVSVKVQDASADADGKTLESDESYTLHVATPTVTIEANTMYD